LLLLKFRRALAAAEAVCLPPDSLSHRNFSGHECAANGILNHLILVHRKTSIIEISMLEFTNSTPHEEKENDQ